MAVAQQTFEHAVASALAGTTVVTSNERAARALRRRCEELLEPGRAHRTPKVLSYAAFTADLWRRAVVCGADYRVLLKPAQSSALWERVVRQAGNAGLHAATAAREAVAAWRLAHAFDIPLDAPEFRSRPESLAFAGWAASFARICRREQWLDSALLEHALADGATKIASHLRTGILLFGFDRITPVQQKFLTALSSAGISVAYWEPAAAPTESAHRLTADDAASEFSLAARWARRMVEADPCVRVGIVVPTLSGCRSTIVQTFTETLNPETLLVTNSARLRTFEVSLGEPLAAVPLVAAALTLLEGLEGEWALRDASALLLSPYVRGADEERDSRASGDLVLRRERRPCISLHDLAQIARGAHCPVFADAIRRCATTVPAAGSMLSPADWTARSLSVLKAAGWPAIKPDSVEFQAVEALQQLLETAASIGVVAPEQITASQFLRTLRQLAGERTFSPENLGTPVQILGHLEAAGSLFDAVWVCGLTDSQWPPRSTPSPLLPIGLQRRYGLPNTSVQDDAEFAAAVLSRLVASATTTILSCPARDADGDVRPTRSIAAARAITPDDLGLAVVTPFEQLLAPACETFEDETAPSPTVAELTVRTAVIEWQSNCPFRAFAQHRLKAEGLEQHAEGIDARDRGKLVDAVLAGIWGKLRDSFTLKNPPEPLANIIEKAVDAATADPTVLPPPASDWDRRFYDLERERMVALAHEWLNAERRRGEAFTVVAHQKQVEIALGNVTVSGRMDRLDQLDSGNYVIIDYKSGSQSNSPRAWAGDRPMRPQLPLYALSKDGALDGLAFARVKRGACSWSAECERPPIFGLNGRAQRDMNQAVAEWRAALTAVAAEYQRGDATIAPLRGERSCNDSFCDLQDLCRFQEILEATVTERESADG